MLINPIQRSKGQIQIDGTEVGTCSWPDFTSALDVQPRQDDDMAGKAFEFPTEFTAIGTYQSGDWNGVREAFGVPLNPTVQVVYKTGQRWFHPTLTLNRARVVNLEPEPVSCTLHVDMKALACEIEYPNFWARPIYWLWRCWMKIQALFRPRKEDDGETTNR